MVNNFKLRIGLRDKKTGYIEVVKLYLFNENCGLMQYPIDLDKWEVLFIDRPTGRCDTNMQMIFENDIVEYDGRKYPIYFADGGFYADGFYNSNQDNPSDMFSENADKSSLIIGNTHNY